MSCFLLSDCHFATIAVHINAKAKELGYVIDSGALADKLKALNTESVNFRYNEKKPRLKCRFDLALVKKVSTAQLIRFISCWVYQSSDNADIKSLEFFAFEVYLYSFFTEEELNDSTANNNLKWTI